MTWRRWLGWSLAVILVLVGLAGLVIGGAWWWLHPKFSRADGIVYGRRLGHDLTFDRLMPVHPNGAGILVLISGSWRSKRDGTQDLVVAPLLRRGYTVFAVMHISQPECSITDIAADIQRAARFIRHHAQEYGVDPQRFGVVGGSSGGHLSLLLATRGGPGPAEAVDPIDRESSAVQAAAVFFPVTDLLNLGPSTENPGDGGPPKSYVKGFGPGATNMATWKVIGFDLSPIYHVTAHVPPVFIVHGGADTLVPVEQSERFAKRVREVGGTIEVVVRPGKKHGWSTMILDVRRFADWFDRWLVKPAGH